MIIAPTTPALSWDLRREALSSQQSRDTLGEIITLNQHYHEISDIRDYHRSVVLTTLSPHPRSGGLEEILDLAPALQ